MNHLIYPIYNGSFSVGMGNIGYDVENIDSYSFLIVSEKSDRAILVDTGFDPSYIPGVGSSSTGFSEYHLEQILRRRGYRMEDINTVIMTHLHWDHTGAMAKFPQARFYVQGEELRSLVHLPVIQECSFSPSHWLPHLQQFELLEGTTKIEPGIRVIFNSGHTGGHQTIEVQTAEGKILLVGDAPFDYTAMWESIPDKFWQFFRQNLGERFYWDDKVRKSISSFLSSHQALTREKPPRMRFREIRKLGAKFFTSHDPSLSRFSADEKPISLAPESGGEDK